MNNITDIIDNMTDAQLDNLINRLERGSPMRLRLESEVNDRHQLKVLATKPFGKDPDILALQDYKRMEKRRLDAGTFFDINLEGFKSLIR